MAFIDKAGAWCALAAVMLMSGVAQAASPAAKCEAAKLKIAGKYSLCRLTVQGKEVKTGLVGSGDFAKCDTTFADKWAAAETKGGTSCPSSGDAGSVQALLLDLTNFTGVALSLDRFHDNLDGTITDGKTGLMWEKQDNLDSVQNFTDPRDADNTYAWSESGTGTGPNGSAFVQFLSELNGSSSDGSTITGCFAGHCDWRLPTIAELTGIVDLSAAGCGSGKACIDPTFGPTQSGFYWSATPSGFPDVAWGVSFNVGLVFAFPKTENFSVRAVRGGL